MCNGDGEGVDGKVGKEGKLIVNITYGTLTESCA